MEQVNVGHSWVHFHFAGPSPLLNSFVINPRRTRCDRVAEEGAARTMSGERRDLDEGRGERERVPGAKIWGGERERG